MGDDSEWMKLPVDQKCEHKVTAGSLVFVSFLFSFVSEVTRLHQPVLVHPCSREDSGPVGLWTKMALTEFLSPGH